MARHNLATRSLRHLRFAHRMMASQPLLARASHISHPPTFIVLDGYQLPVGRIVRRLPLNDAPWIADGAGSADSVVSPAAAETVLRLLPRLSETHDDTTSAASEIDVEAPPFGTVLSEQTHTRRIADDEPPALTTPATTMPPARVDGLRPRSRIVELPGIVSLPVEEAIAEEPDASDNSAKALEDTPENARSDFMADGQVTADSELAQPPLMREEGEESAAVSPATTPRDPAEEAPSVPPAGPASALRRRGKQTGATPPRASDALFPPTDADRSPAAWLARLQHAEAPTSSARPASPDAPQKPGNEPPPPSAPAQRPGARGSRKGVVKAQASPDAKTTSATTPLPEQSSPVEEQPVPLPDSSRTLLHTLTGVDPASVRVYRGPVAARAASAQQADALTDGGAIALGAGHATDTPETLGLLAHELTHVAQRRSPRFVPPISQISHYEQRAYAGTPSPMPHVSQPAASPADEESQAMQVEARVTRVARAKARAMPPHSILPGLPVESEVTTTPAYEMPSRPDTQPVWGNLPAPWEPLPDWMSTPTESAASAPPPAPQTATQASSAPAHAPSTNAPNSPGTQRAERGRSLPTGTEEPSRAHFQETSAPEPDLDQLAQQVHAILKRRLAAERRRFG